MNAFLLQLKTAALMLFMPYALPSILDREAEAGTMTPYQLWMTVGTLAIFALYGLRCLLAGRGKPIRKRALLTAAVALALTVRLGLELARVGFVTLTETFDLADKSLYWDDDVLIPLFSFDITHLSFFCGAAGVCLAVWLANCITRRGKGAVTAGMDAFAPFGALMVVLFRLGEISDPLHFGGKQLPENSPFAFFPFALEGRVAGGAPDGPGWVPAWFPAVCILSAVFALAWAVAAFVIHFRGRGRTGLVFTLTLFALCVPQIMCESMRGESIRWLFVHVEQLFCAITALAVLLFWIAGSRGVSFLKRFAPLFIMLACIGLIVVAEFAIDGKWFNFSKTACYIFMTLVLAAMGFAGGWAARNWNRSGARSGKAACASNE